MKKKGKNNFDVFETLYDRIYKTSLPPTIPLRTKIEKETKKKEKPKMRRKDAGCTIFTRQKFLFFSYTLFFFVSLFFSVYFCSIFYIRLHRTIAWISVESGSSFSRPLATIDYLNLI